MTYEVGTGLIPRVVLQGTRVGHHSPLKDVWHLVRRVQEAGASSVVVAASRTAGLLEGQPGNCMLDLHTLPHHHCLGSHILLLHSHRHTQHQAHTRALRQATPESGCHTAS